MATIIKNDAYVPSSGQDLRGVAYDFSDLRRQADDYLETVRGEAARIIQAAQEESAKIKRDAEQAGRQAAQAAVESILDKKVAQRMESLTPALATAVQQIEDARQDWLHHWETSLLQLAQALAARVLHRELREQPEIALTWIQAALQLASGSAEITVQLHPTDHQTLGPQVEQLAATCGRAAPTTIVASEAISLGGCVVTTEFGSIDMQLETQLARLAEELN